MASPAERAALRLGTVGVVLFAVVTPAPAEPAAPAAPPGAPEETHFQRDGFAIGLGLGPAIFKGAGAFSEVGGVGAAFDLRVGTTATDRLLWQLDLTGGAYLVEIVDQARPDASEQVTNNHATLTLGVQAYLLDAFWLRGGAGIASFARSKGGTETDRHSGLALLGGGGLDLFRRGMFCLDGEAQLALARYEAGTMGQLSFALVANWY